MTNYQNNHIDTKLKALENKQETIIKILKRQEEKINSLAQILDQSIKNISNYTKRVNDILEEVKTWTAMELI